MPSPEELLDQLTKLILGSPDEPGRERLAQEAIAATGDPQLAQQLLGMGLSRERFVSSQAARGVSSGALGERERGLFDVMQGLELAPRGGRGGPGSPTGRYQPDFLPEPEAPPPVPPPPTATLTGAKNVPPAPARAPMDPRLVALQKALVEAQNEQRREEAVRTEVSRNARLDPRQMMPAQAPMDPLFSNLLGRGPQYTGPGALGAFRKSLFSGGLEAMDDLSLARRTLQAGRSGDEATLERGLKILHSRNSFSKDFTGTRLGARSAANAYHDDLAKKLANKTGRNWKHLASTLRTNELENFMGSDNPEAIFEEAVAAGLTTREAQRGLAAYGARSARDAREAAARKRQASGESGE